MKYFILSLIAAMLTIILVEAYAVDLKYDELRYCGKPQRNAAGKIIRSTAVKESFRKLYPCPVTSLNYGACTGWAIDHVIPLASCGCDSVTNMQWLPDTIKSCHGTECKDRWERKVYTCR